MNRYGSLVRRHYQEFRPHAFAALPVRYFDDR
jgi:hypothetical protein